VREGIHEKGGAARSGGVWVTAPSIASQDATTTKESAMSLTNARRSMDAATLARPAGHPIPQTPGRGHTSVLGRALVEGVLAEGPYPPRAVTPAHVNQRRDADGYRCDDPSNYLG
jgi:hypothetical protein